MKVHKWTDKHVPSLNALAGSKFDLFVMDPDDVRTHVQLAHRLRKFLNVNGFPADQAADRAHVGRLFNLAGVPAGMTKKHAASVVDFLANARSHWTSVDHVVTG